MFLVAPDGKPIRFLATLIELSSLPPFGSFGEFRTISGSVILKSRPADTTASLSTLPMTTVYPEISPTAEAATSPEAKVKVSLKVLVVPCGPLS